MLSPIASVVPASFLDFAGRVSCSIFLRYCRWACPYCHNHALLTDKWDTSFGMNYVLNVIQKTLSFTDSLSVSGGEPLLHIDFLEEFLPQVKKLGLAIKLDTNGSEPYALERLLRKGLLDYVAMDVKAPFTEEAYSRATGVYQDRSCLALIWSSMRLLGRFDISHTYRTTCVPGILGKEDILSIGRDLLGEKHWVLQDFSPGNALELALRQVKGYGRKVLEEWGKEVRGLGYVKKVTVLAGD